MSGKAKPDALTPHPSRGGWAVRVQIKGQRVTFWALTKTELKANVSEQLERADRERRGLAADLPPKDYNEACDRLLATHRGRDSSIATLRSNLQASRRKFGRTRPDEISRWAIELWQQELLDGEPDEDGEWIHPPLAPGTVRNYHKSLSQALQFCYDHEWLDRNRAASVQAPAGGEKPDPFESWDEVFRIARCLEAVHPPYGRMARMAGGLGLRPQEACALTESSVNRKEGTLRIWQTWDDTAGAFVAKGKTKGSLATLPLTAIAREVVDEMPQLLDATTLLFLDPDGEPIDMNEFRKGPWRDALKAAGVRYRGPAQLRHTFATLSLLHGGLDKLKDVSVAMRHETVKTTETSYVKLVEEMRRKGAAHISTGMPSYRATGEV